MALVDNKAKIQALIAGINALPEAGGGEAPEPSLQEKTVTPATFIQSVTPDSGYDGLSKVTVNAMPSATQATPSIEVSSGGLITASTTQSAGYVAAGTKSATKQLETQAAQTITPGTSDKTIAAGKYLTGVQTIKGDANLVAGNIKSGVSIFGVNGTLEEGTGGGGVDLPTCNLVIVGDADYVSMSYAKLTENGLEQREYEEGRTFNNVVVNTLFGVVIEPDEAHADENLVVLRPSIDTGAFTYHAYNPNYYAIPAQFGGETVTLTIEW